MGKWPMSPICPLLWHYHIIAFCWKQPRFKQRAARKNSSFNQHQHRFTEHFTWEDCMREHRRCHVFRPKVSSTGGWNATAGVSLWVSPIFPRFYIPSINMVDNEAMTKRPMFPKRKKRKAFLGIRQKVISSVWILLCYTIVESRCHIFITAVADRGQRQSLRRHLLAHAGEAGVRLRWAELREQLWVAEGTLQRQNADTSKSRTVQRWVGSRIFHSKCIRVLKVKVYCILYIYISYL